MLSSFRLALPAYLLTRSLADSLFEHRRKPRARKQNRAGDDEKDQRRTQSEIQARAIRDHTDDLRRKSIPEKVNAEKIH